MINIYIKILLIFNIYLFFSFKFKFHYLRWECNNSVPLLADSYIIIIYNFTILMKIDY